AEIERPGGVDPRHRPGHRALRRAAVPKIAERDEADRGVRREHGGRRDPGEQPRADVEGRRPGGPGGTRGSRVRRVVGRRARSAGAEPESQEPEGEAAKIHRGILRTTAAAPPCHNRAAVTDLATIPPAPTPPAPLPAARPSLAERVPPGGTTDPDEILTRFVDRAADAGYELYPAQEEALLELMAGKHVILNTPTGSGKSLVALGLHFKALCEGVTSYYTSPIKALASEKFFALCEDFGAAHVGMLTGDASINATAKVLCCTAEVLSNMALRQGETLDAPYVVMDEFHYYSDNERGVAWQVPLLVLPYTRF